eukprot:215531_1
MKLLRFGPVGQERPGLVDSQGRIRDLSDHVDDIKGETLSPSGLERLRLINSTTLPLVPNGVRIGPPVGQVGEFIAVGLNYIDHAKECNIDIPSEPVLFNKLSNTIVGPYDDVMLPRGAKKVDWEVELAFIIGKRARYVDERSALDYISGYTICNDISERHCQLQRGGQWMKGKCFETFGPLGPWLVTPDEISKPQSLDMRLNVNGQTMQCSSTCNMIFCITYLLSYISQLMVLEPGDVVTTGTPAGVGNGHKPFPIYLKEDDVMDLSIDGLGSQKQKVVPFKL